METLVSFVSKVDIYRAVLAGFCLGIGFIVPSLWWLGIIGIVWTFYALKTAVTYKQAIWVVFIIWWIKSLCSLSWYSSVYPIEWLGIANHVHQLMLIFLYWSTSSLWLAGGGIALAVIGRFLFIQPYISERVWYVSLPVVWVLCELISGGTFALFSFGPGSTIGPYFVSFGMVGYLLGTTALGIWLAVVAGVYGLSFLVASAASFILLLIQARKLKQLIMLCAGMLFVGMGSSFIQPQYHSRDVTVIGIDTRFDSLLLSSINGEQIKINEIKQAVDVAIGLSPTAILLPEDSRYLQSQFNSAYLQQAMSLFKFIHKNTETIVIDSGRETDTRGATVLRANIIDGVSNTVWQFDKQFLVPQGEYIPYLYHVLFRLLGYRDTIDSIARDSSYRPGTLLQTTSLPDYLPGVLFCFESVSPSGVTSLAQTRPLPFVAHPISHSWFHFPRVLWQQQDVMLQIQARYSGVPIVSAANMATGKLYLPNGKIESGTVIHEGDRYRLRLFTF